MKYSVVIPARNEEHWLGACIDSVRESARQAQVEAEVVVVLNRCTDGTERIAREKGGVVTASDARCLSAIRNHGARAASGEVLVTIDADSRMSANLLSKVDLALRDPKVIGGSVAIWFERWSLGLVLTFLSILPALLVLRISGGAFWVRREVFGELGGFDESRRSFEDVDFALRLRRLARATGRKAKILWRASIVTSCRKFDRFGDWYLFRNALRVIGLWRRSKGSERMEDELWYDTER